MTGNSNGGTLSRRLWEARPDGRQVRVDGPGRPRDEASAYAVQHGVTEASGYEIAGFKIGATAQVAMDLLGVSGPFFGPLYREAFRENDAAASLPMAHSPGIESKFAVSLAADLPRRAEAWTKEEVEAAVAWVGPAFEIVGTRLESGLPGAGMLAITDGGANIDFVRGPSGTAWRDADLTAQRKGRDPASGQTTTIAASRAPTFKAATTLPDIVKHKPATCHRIRPRSVQYIPYTVEPHTIVRQPVPAPPTRTDAAEFRSSSFRTACGTSMLPNNVPDPASLRSLRSSMIPVPRRDGILNPKRR